MKELDPDINTSETEELVKIANKCGLHKIAKNLLREEEDEEEEETLSPFEECGTRLPSQHSRSAVWGTLRGMGVSWD